MKKYKIILDHYNPDTKAATYNETLTTKSISEERCIELIKAELLKSKHCIWSIKPFSKTIYLAMENK